jgi:N-glycosylase/DNA lyase
MNSRVSERLSRDELRDLHAGRRAAIRARLEDFARVPREAYFYELAYCLMTPQSSAVNAGKTVALLEERRFLDQPFDPEALLFRKENYIRFHRTKAKRLLAARERFPDIRDRLIDRTDSRAARAWLVDNVNGLGWKEASHLLRNVGHRDLAILDRHILKNLVRTGAIRSVPATLTPKKYLAIERSFARFAAAVAIPMDELDLLFWSMETGEILK